MFAGWYILRPPIPTDDGLVCDWRRKTKLQACLSAQFGDMPAAALIAYLEGAGFQDETQPEDDHHFFRKRAGGWGNYIVVVLVWEDGEGTIERIAVN